MAKEEILIDLKIDAEESNESINSLRASVREMTKARNDANLSTAEGRALVENLNKIINAHNAKIKENVDALTKQKINVGNYKNDIVDATNSINIAGTSIGDLTSKFSSLASPLAAAGAGVSALIGLYLKSSAGAKDFESAQNQLNQSITSFSNSLSKILGASGDGDGFFSKLAFAFNMQIFGLSNALQGKIADNAQFALKKLELTDIEAKRFAKNQLDLSEQQRQIRDNETKSYNERLEAAKSVDKFVNAREEELVKVQEQKIAQLKILLSLDSNNLDLKKKIKEAEFELSDIQEDSQGKRTEALNGIRALEQSRLQEFRDDIAKRTELELQLEVQADIKAAKEAERDQKALEASAKRIEDKRLELEGIYLLNEQLNIQLDEEAVVLDEKQEAALQKDLARARQRVEIAKITESQKIGFISQGIALASNLLYKQSGEYKALAITQGLINTYAGASAAVAPPPVGAGPVFGPILAAFTIAKGLVNVGKIAGFANGGLIKMGAGLPIQRSNGDNVLATLKIGEVILNQRQQSALGGSSTFRSIGVPGFAEGGVVGFPSSTISGATNSFFDLSRLEQTIANLKVQVAVTDINDGQKNYAEITDRAQF